MIPKLISASKYIILLPVVCTMVLSLVLMIYQSALVVLMILRLFRGVEVSGTTGKGFAIDVIESVDVFLIAIGSYLIGVGLYSLLVDEELALPKWLRPASFEDLKGSLISVVVAVLAVLFLKQAVAWDGAQSIVGFGAANALIIGALGLFLMMGHHR